MFIKKAATVFAINQKNISLIDLRFRMHIHWGKTMDAFEKPASQLIKYVHIDPITDFCILVIPEAIFPARAFKFGSVGALNTLIKINPRLCDNRKILILPNIWRIF